MPRAPRIAFENGFFHVFNRGLAKLEIFTDEGDYRKFLNKLQELTTKNEYDHSVYAYVLMPNHFHLLIQTQKTPIAKIMSSLLTSYAVYFNKKHARVGPLFQNRFKSKLCEKEIYFLGASRYILLNPLEAGLVQNPADYKWSSYQEIFNSSEFNIIDREEVNRLINSTLGEKNNYRQFLLDGIPIVKDLAKQYTFTKQVEGNPQFNVVTQKQYLRNRIKQRIENLFHIKT